MELGRNNSISSSFSDYLKNKPFREVLPWIGGDLQTLRDTFVIDFGKSKKNKKIFFPIHKILSKKFECDYLLGFLELPENLNSLRGFVIVTHGLGGSTKRFGLRRISRKLVNNGFGVLKLNLRGSGSARYLAKGNYCARCSSDVISAINHFKKFINLEFKDLIKMNNLPIYGVGLSLGGTILLNSCLDYDENKGEKLLDGLACVSSPLDLSSCSLCIEKSRNYIYQKWLLNRLKNQLWEGYNDEGKILNNEKLRKKIRSLKSIREFDQKFTAPSWGFNSLEDYYVKASPIFRIQNSIKKLPQMLFIHAKDDPWVPYNATLNLRGKFIDKFTIFITEKGGHNGFHSINGCWSDEVVKNWFISI
ncbi:alpha/beta hydrolase [Prochlorococcus marinus XMU1406]|uniref:alpha/beta fold hydrolase n=1 Tax=Prochlorococcus marinus TaxID=1219 RepID=UPI001ADB1028|nr:alpha/beta fold hydrolase [Prochlorococcus marinus]MBO8206732.1 alpha/beta hydrolase [Prochlorococcus marinus XMU1406]MCR8542549.1 alpha/beta hydrolase [Prochlorococcus marinus XMU1427]